MNSGKFLLSEVASASLALDLTADTTGTTTSSVVDMQGYDGLMFAIKMGDVDAAAVLTFTVKENTANSTSSPTPTSVTLATTSAGVITSGALVCTESSGNLDDKIILIDLGHQAVSKRYVFFTVGATVESYEIDSAIAIRYRSRDLPVTQSSDVYATAYVAG